MISRKGFLFVVLWLVCSSAFAAIPYKGFTEAFDVRVGDINGDGRNDIYIRPYPNIVIISGDINTPIVLPGVPVTAFFLQQNSNGTFTLLKTPTASQLATASGWSSSGGVNLKAIDFAGDGIQELLIERGQASGLGSLDLIVYAAATSDNPPTIHFPVTTAFQQSLGAPSSIYAAPSLPSSSRTGVFTIDWQEVNWIVTHYELQERLNSGSWTTLYSGLNHSLNVTGKTGGLYSYRVRACNAAGCGGFSPTSTMLFEFQPAAPASVSLSPANSTDGNLTVSWSSVAGDVDYYDVQQSFKGGEWGTAVQVSGLTHAVTVERDGDYQYRVAACNQEPTYTACSLSTESNSVNVKLPLTTPIALTSPAADADGAYTIQWQNIGGDITKNTLQERVNGGAWQTLTDTAVTEFAVTGRIEAVYDYQVRACDASGCTAYSAPITTEVIPNPTVPGDIQGISVTTEPDYSLTWGPATGRIDTYNIERRRNGGDWITVQDTAQLQLSLTGEQWGTYEYRVSACNAAGCGPTTPIKTVQVNITEVLQPIAPQLATAPSPQSSDVTASDQIGSVAGQFRVDESGNATYNIPLTVPAGTAGVTPQLALSYSSSAGNGLVGIGWNLQGLSAISRCRQTLGQDDNAEAITWTHQDRFCLDGQRLLVQGSATYGAVGATYKTEVDSFVKVTSHGGSLGKPSYFSVKRKDGSISYYGNTSNSKHKTPNGAHTLNWTQSRFEDSVGNGINYTYANDVHGHRISEISYGGASENLSTVSFGYAGRSDEISGYVAGHLFVTKRVLINITVKNNGSEIKRYNLEYLANSGSYKSKRLNAIEECSGSNCLPKTTFDWSQPNYTFSSSGSSLSLGGSHSRDLGAGNFKPADINGDGLMDVVWFYHLRDGSSDIDYVLRYAISDGTKLVPATFSDGATGKRWNNDAGLKYEIIDYNADGRQDVAFKNGSSGNWFVYLSAPQSNGTWKLNASYIDTGISVVDTVFSDFNSDGIGDALYEASAGQSKIRLGQSSSQSAHASSSFYSFASPANFITTSSYDRDNYVSGSDWNGDGIQDYLVPVREPTCLTPSICNILLPVWNVFTHSKHEEAAFAKIDLVIKLESLSGADLNGDGLSDLFYRHKTNDFEFYYRISNGNSFNAPQKITGWNPEYGLRNLDYNLDGYQDILWHDTSAEKIKVRLWQPREQALSSVDITVRSTDGDTKDAHLFFDVNADGVNDYVVFKDDRLYTYLAEGVDASSNKIVKINNGLGAETDITYEPLGKSGHYERLTVGASGSSKFCFAADCPTYNFATNNVGGFYSALNSDWTGTDTLGKTGPVLELNGPMPVVTQVSSSAPTAANPNAKSSISYYYAEAKIQASGRGMLGFERLKTVDNQTGVQTVTTYRQDWPFIGYPANTKVYSASGKLLSDSQNTWRLKGFQSSWGNTAKTQGSAALGSLQPYIAQSVEKTYYLKNDGATQGTLMSEVITDNIYDTYGNPLQIKVRTKDRDGNLAQTKTTVNTYGTTTWEQEMGRLSRTEVTTTRGADSKTRTSAFNYYDTGVLKGLLKDEIIEPDLSQYTLTTSYDYDSFGNKIKATQSAAGLESRITESLFDTDGRYLLQTQNGFGQITQKVLSYNNFGQPLIVEDINGVQTHNTYSPMGRKYFEANDSGAFSQTLLKTCDSHCPSTAVYMAQTKQAGGMKSKTYYDILGREVRTATRRFDGNYTFVDTEYDNLGRVVRKSEPHGGNAPYWTEFKYDILGRIDRTFLPGISTAARMVYGSTNGQPLTISYNPLGQEKREVKNVLGELTNVYDHMGGQISYQYDVEGNLATVTQHGSPADPHTVQVGMAYDHLGRKIAMNDPDKGNWTYVYNAFGELIEQTDAKNQTSTLTYDKLGRMVGRIDRLASNAIESNTTWSYNNATSGTGLSALLNVEDSVSGYIKVMGYDGLGRLNETVTSIAANDDHYEKVTYDQYGRTYQNFDAAGDGTWQDNATINLYNAYGYLEKVADAVYYNGAPRTTYYTVKTMDNRGNVTEALHGNGATTTNHYHAATGRLINLDTSVLPGLGQIQDHTYTWDDIGNLTQRQDQSGSKNLSETFSYDQLNRLTSSQVAGQSAQTLTYNSLGNITYKSDVGNYTYGNSHINQGAGPHAVTATSDGVTYQYDDNGNMISDSAVGNLGGRTLTYTTFDKPNQITKGNHTTTFKYGPDRARYLRTDNDGTDTTITKYIGNVEKISKADGTQEIKRYIGNVLITISKDNSNTVTQEKAQYLFKDHLGSIDVITDALGTIEQELSFDPWGQRRNGIDWNSVAIADLLNFDHSITTRGFTGHEMLDEVGLIHMNGRVYDARIARFLQADPYIDGVNHTQGHNRYSYGKNNPLNGSDPSGYFFDFSSPLDIIVAVISFAVGLVNPQLGAQIWLTYEQYRTAAHIFAVGAYVATSAFSNGASNLASGYSQADPIGEDDVRSPSDFNDIWRIDLEFDKDEETARKVINHTYSHQTGGKFTNAAETQTFLATQSPVTSSGSGTAEEQSSDSSTLLVDLALEVLPGGGIYKCSKGGCDAVDWIGATVDLIPGIGKIGKLTKLRKLVRRRKTPSLGCSFLAGTMIATSAGAVAIEDIEPGDKVLSRSDKTGEVEEKSVRAIFANPHEEILHLTVKGDDGEELILTTKEHPFYVKDQGWMEAIDLTEADNLVDLHGEELDIVSVNLIRQEATAYNFEVADFHTYAVGANEAWVHNVCDNRPPNLSPPGSARKGAFREAKRQAGVPVSQQPSRVLQNVDRRGRPQPGKIYEFEVPASGGGTRTVRIRDDASGHDFGVGNSQNRGPHFNNQAGDHFDY